MKNVHALVAALCLIAVVVKAEEGKKHRPMTEEQKKLYREMKLTQEMIKKYDTNKDGKVDKDETSKISDEDKKKMKDAGVDWAHLTPPRPKKDFH